MTYPPEPPYEPGDDVPIDPNPAYYAGPPVTGSYSPPPPARPPAHQGGYHPVSAPAPPPPGYPGAYPAPWDTGRPVGVMGASVLAYIDAGLLILAGLLLLVGASAVDSFNQAFGSNDTNAAVELATDGLVNLVAAGLMIAGGVLMETRSERGRLLF